MLLAQPTYLGYSIIKEAELVTFVKTATNDSLTVVPVSLCRCMMMPSAHQRLRRQSKSS